MIIVGYQGIGKTSLSKRKGGIIDLESSNFFVDGKRAENWHKVYCNIAIHLAEQNYHVFVSSHEIVRKELNVRGYSDKAIVYPSLKLKDAWIAKLQSRYEQSRTLQEKEKNYKAYMNAVESYEENIRALMGETEFKHYVITAIDYDLLRLIENAENRTS